MTKWTENVLIFYIIFINLVIKLILCKANGLFLCSNYRNIRKRKRLETQKKYNRNLHKIYYNKKKQKLISTTAIIIL